MATDSKYGKLASNTVLFAISNFGSKALSFVLVPLYTYVLTTEEYGTADIIYATCTILLYIFSLSISEGTLRFSLSKEYENRKVIVNSITVSVVMSLLLIIIMTLFNVISIFHGYTLLMYLIVTTQIFYGVLTQYAKGTDKVRIFAEAGILQTLFVAVSNIILLAVYKLGVRGYLISYALGFGLSSLYTGFRLRIWKELKPRYFDKTLIREMVAYSLPMVATGLSWWILNASDKYVIAWFLGSDANGIYAVSHKIPSVVTIFASFFNSAWQISAIQERESENDKSFYNNVFTAFACLIILVSSFVIGIIKFVIPLVISNDYIEAINYIPLLIFACVFQVFANFFGGLNLAYKKTKNLIFNSLIAAAVNLILNIILTPYMGMYGTALATVIGCLIMWILRIRDVDKNMGVRFYLRRIYVALLLLAMQILVFMMNDILVSTVFELLILILILILFHQTIMKYIGKLRRKNG